MRYRSDKIDPVEFPQLSKLVWDSTKVISPQEALDAYTLHWKLVDYPEMDNNERMLLCELVDEIAPGGIFMPYFDDLGQDRRQVTPELKLMQKTVDRTSQNDTMNFMLGKLTKYRRK